MRGCIIAPGVDPDEDGMAAFNNTGLINWIPGVNAYPVSLMVDSFAFAGTPPVIYALPASALYGGFFPVITLGSSGLQYTQAPFTPGGTTVASGDLVVSDGSLLYTQNGQIWNPSTQAQIGTYNPAPWDTQSVIPDDSLGRTFFLDTESSCVTAAGGVCAYDQTNLNLTGSLAFPAVFQPELEDLVRWGNDGFAMFASNFVSTPSSNQFITFRSSMALPSTANNPAPKLTSLGSSTVTPGGPNFLLSVIGSNFVRGAEVDWNGSPRTTTYQSATQLTAYISRADIASAGSAQVTVVNPAPGGGASSPLTVFIGSPTQLSISPTALSFGSQPVGASSPPSTITVTNTGSTNLIVGSITISGANASDFSKSADACSSAAVKPNGTCTVAVIFTPSAAGNRTAALSITDNGTGGVQTVALSGTGASPSASLSPASLKFSGQLVGTTSDAQAVSLSNNGSMALTVSKIAVTGNFSQTNNCGSSLPAGSSCSVKVTFTPKAGGSLTGSLTITDNNNGVSGSTQSLNLSGTGMDFSLAAASGSGTTATVNPGQTATYTLALDGLGGLNQAVNFTCAGAPSEAACTISPSSATLGSSATNVTVSVSTTAASTLSPRGFRPSPPASPAPKGLLLLVAFLLGLALRWKQVGTRQRTRFLILAVALLLTLLMAACGGGGTTTNPGTPAGSYTLTITGSTGSGSAALSHSMTLTLNVS